MLKKQIAVMLAIILSANVSYGQGCGCAAGNVGMCPWEIASAAVVSVMPTYVTDTFFDPKVAIPVALSGVAVAFAIGSSPVAMVIGVPSTMFFVKNAFAVIVPEQEEAVSKFAAEKLLPLGMLGLVSGGQRLLSAPSSCGSEVGDKRQQRFQKIMSMAFVGAVGEVVVSGALEALGVKVYVKERVDYLTSLSASAVARVFPGFFGREQHDHHAHDHHDHHDHHAHDRGSVEAPHDGHGDHHHGHDYTPSQF